MLAAKSIFQDADAFNEANDVGEGFPPVSGPALLAHTLAWAAKRKIPFDEALVTLTDYGLPSQAALGGKLWNHGLWKAIALLKEGKSLQEALSKGLRWQLPGYFLLAVGKSERDGTLEKTLPCFSRSLSLSAEMKRLYLLTLCIPLLEFLFIMISALFLAILVMPVVKMIFREVVGVGNLPFMIANAKEISKFLTSPAFLLILFGVFILWKVVSVRKVGHWLFGLLEWGLIALPGVREFFIDRALLELSGSMHSYLKAGFPLPEALSFSAEACSHPWLKRRLEGCRRRIERGEDWLVAWEAMKLKVPLDEMALRNAAARDAAPDGFRLMMEWHYSRALRMSQRLALLLFVGVVFLNAGIVFLFSDGFFETLVKIIEGY